MVIGGRNYILDSANNTSKTDSPYGWAVGERLRLIDTYKIYNRNPGVFTEDVNVVISFAAMLTDLAANPDSTKLNVYGYQTNGISIDTVYHVQQTITKNKWSRVVATASDSAIGGDFFTPARFHDAIYCNEQHFVVNGANVRVEDFVTVQGETTTTAPLNIPWSWRYRKWNSGILELWGEGYFVNWSMPHAYYGLYYNSDGQATYPVTLAVVYANIVATVNNLRG